MLHPLFCNIERSESFHNNLVALAILAACLQVWDSLTAKMRKDLQYQADEQFMMHETAVLSLAVSLTSELLVSGSQDGKIKVRQWSVSHQTAVELCAALCHNFGSTWQIFRCVCLHGLALSWPVPCH